MDCQGLISAKAESQGKFQELEHTLKAARESDQGAGIVAVLVLPPVMLAGAGIHNEERTALDGLQKRLDRLNRLIQVKGCAPATL